MPLFGAAFAAPNKGIIILSDLVLYHQCSCLQKIEEFKDFLRPLCSFQYFSRLFFKDFSRKPSKLKCFSSLCEPCYNTLFTCMDLACLTASTFFQISGTFIASMASSRLVKSSSRRVNTTTTYYLPAWT